MPSDAQDTKPNLALVGEIHKSVLVEQNSLSINHSMPRSLGVPSLFFFKCLRY
jgi:hypothetical protein